MPTESENTPRICSLLPKAKLWLANFGLRSWHVSLEDWPQYPRIPHIVSDKNRFPYFLIHHRFSGYLATNTVRIAFGDFCQCAYILINFVGNTLGVIHRRNISKGCFFFCLAIMTLMEVKNLKSH